MDCISECGPVFEYSPSVLMALHLTIKQRCHWLNSDPYPKCTLVTGAEVNTTRPQVKVGRQVGARAILMGMGSLQHGQPRCVTSGLHASAHNGGLDLNMPRTEYERCLVTNHKPVGLAEDLETTGWLLTHVVHNHGLTHCRRCCCT